MIIRYCTLGIKNYILHVLGVKLDRFRTLHFMVLICISQINISSSTIYSCLPRGISL